MTTMTDTRTVIRIVAYGIPGPQGSKSFKGMRRGKPVLVESSKKVKPWREAVEDAARVVLYSLTREQRRAFPLDEPLAGRFIFTLPKPASAPKRIRTWPMKYPDTSKLLRSTEDALTKAGVWVDDARLVELDRLVKVYPNEDPEALDRPGVVIEIRRIADLTGDPS